MPKSFPQKYKNLSSQIENYIFGAQSIKNNYAANTCFWANYFGKPVFGHL